MSHQEAGRVVPVHPDRDEADVFFRIWKTLSGIVFSFGAFILLIQATACIVILVLSKHEKPHVPLRVFIIGQLCACVICLIHLFIHFLSQRIFVTQIVNVASDSDSDAADDAILSYAIVQVVLGYITGATFCFTLGWYIAGSIWVSMASSTRSETPILFWGCLSFIASAAGGFALAFIVLFLACCFAPCLLICFG